MCAKTPNHILRSRCDFYFFFCLCLCLFVGLMRERGYQEMLQSSKNWSMWMLLFVLCVYLTFPTCFSYPAVSWRWDGQTLSCRRPPGGNLPSLCGCRWQLERRQFRGETRTCFSAVQQVSFGSNAAGLRGCQGKKLTFIPVGHFCPADNFNERWNKTFALHAGK